MAIIATILFIAMLFGIIAGQAWAFVLLAILICVVIFSIYQSKQKTKELNGIVEDVADVLKNKQIIITKGFVNDNKYVQFDFNKCKMVYREDNNKVLKIYDFSDIVECDLIENNSTIAQGGVGRAIVGGVLAGGVGAVVGASTRKESNVVSSLCIRIVLSDVTAPVIIFPFINTPMQRNADYDNVYLLANELYAILLNIINKKISNVST